MQPTRQAFKLGVVLLAAGRSSRMGRPKQLLPWGKTSVLGHLLDQWQALGVNQIAVVCAAEDERIEAELDHLGFSANDRIINAAPERGMFSSIQCAAQWAGWKTGLTHWALVLGDQPHLSGQTLQALLDFSAVHSAHISLPKQGGHRRHPVIFPRRAFQALAISTERDLKGFLDFPPLPIAFCELDDPALGLDIDDPGDYERATRLFFRR